MDASCTSHPVAFIRIPTTSSIEFVSLLKITTAHRPDLEPVLRPGSKRGTEEKAGKAIRSVVLGPIILHNFCSPMGRYLL
jgi:hypothetical protein